MRNKSINNVKNNSSWIISFLVILISIGIIVYCYPIEKNERELYDLEIAKAFMQLVIVIGLGMLLKVAYDQANRKREEASYAENIRREKEDAMQGVRKSLYNDLVKVRTDVDVIRRTFMIQRASDQLEGYDEAVQGLIQVRSELARLWHDVNVGNGVLRETELFQEKIGMMKDYLDNLLNEYNDKKDSLVPATSSSKFCTKNKMPKFTDFLKSNNNYVENFLGSYRQAMVYITSSILKS